MDIRKQIIEQLSKEPTFGNYKQLKYSIVSNDIETIARIDLWFQGVIESLYYRPNKYVLVLEGKGGIGKTEFFRRLFHVPIKEVWATSDLKDLIYTDLALNFEFTKKSLNYPMEENFIVEPRIEGMFFEYKTLEDFEKNLLTVHVDQPCNKRLASYCSTTNHWHHPPRKNFIVLHLESINQELFNNIDKLQLWIEIFNKFKPEGK